uniref:uncharacterized protein LOC120340884 n=1 Tax=Styela clava TaxID=7725 RepID=UPI00193AC600|nr:uncharacterized protein LOC120340884 [Styela clava]
MLVDRFYSTLSVQGLSRVSIFVQFMLGSSIRILTSVGQRLPLILAAWTVSLSKLLLISMVGFTAWVNSFPVEQFSATFSFVILCISAAYSSYVYLGRNENDAVCKKIDFWDQEMKTIREKWICAVEDGKAIKDAEQPERQCEKTQSEIKRMQDLLTKSTEQNKELEREVQERRKDAITASKNFRRKLDEMESVIESMKVLEQDKKATDVQLRTEYETKEQFKKDILMLQDTIQTLNKQNRKLAAENNRLRMQMTEQTSRDEEEYISDVREIAQRLQTSLSSAKGKLSRVGDFLKNDDSVVMKRTYKRPRHLSNQSAR